MKYDENPFAHGDEDRKKIWDMLVLRDIDAFLASDFSLVENDFKTDGFMGLDAQKSFNPDNWLLRFDSVKAYADVWTQQAKDFANESFAEDPREGLFRVTTLRDIEIKNNLAVIHKKFDGFLKKKSGEFEHLNWQTIYRCQKINKAWKIIGFVGYLPNPTGEFLSTTHRFAGGSVSPSEERGKILPQGASQHVTAGPYSPVLEISGSRLVVISGQAPIDTDGKVIGETIEEQTRFTLENCQKQLATANIGLADVFKVNVFLINLNLWGRFNKVYQEIMPKPFPARTAVQTPLLYNFLVEIEMWGIKK